MKLDQGGSEELMGWKLQVESRKSVYIHHFDEGVFREEKSSSILLKISRRRIRTTRDGEVLGQSESTHITSF